MVVNSPLTMEENFSSADGAILFSIGVQKQAFSTFSPKLDKSEKFEI